MTLPTRRLAVVVGLTALLGLTAPTLTTAQAATPSHSVTPLVKHAFPSSTSTVIGSVGFIDDQQVGYFWSAARGDSVEETFSGPAKITKAKLDIDVPYNGLTTGAEVDWTLSINGKDVGSFVVPAGDMSPIVQSYHFKAIKGGTYDVKIRVTNEVPSGDGAITLRYAGDGPHSITLKK